MVRRNGFTLIELLIVIALIMIMGTASTPFLSNFIRFNNFDTASQNLVGSLRKAQSYAMSSRSGQVWGVCLQGNLIRLFAGSCASPTFSQDTPLETGITVNGLTTTTFNLRGEPSAPVTIQISSDTESDTYAVNSAGRISKE